MKFERSDTPTIMDGKVVRFHLKNHGTGEISASRNGVMVSGYFPAMTSRYEVASFLKQLMEAVDLADSISASDRNGGNWKREE